MPHKQYSQTLCNFKFDSGFKYSRFLPLGHLLTFLCQNASTNILDTHFWLLRFLGFGLWMSSKMFSILFSVYAVRIIIMGWKSLPSSLNNIYESSLLDCSSSWYNLVIISTTGYIINYIY